MFFEHRLYLPMFGFSVFFVSAFYTLFFTKRQKASILVFLILIGVLSFLTYKRNTIWKDEFTLCNDTIKKSPNHPRAYVNLGQAYKGQGNLKKAKELYSKALEIHPEYPTAHNNLSSSLIEEGKFAEAEEHVKFAIQKDPRNPLYRANLGIVLLEEGNIEEAKKQLNKAL